MQVPADLWSRIRRAIQTGARLPVLVQEAELGFDLDPFSNACARFLHEIDARAFRPGAQTQDNDQEQGVAIDICAISPCTKQPLSSPDGWIRLPGMFRRWELADVIDAGEDFYFEPAGACDAGVALFAVFHRQHRAEESTP